MKTLKKEFCEDTWKACIGKVYRFINDYNLELINLNVQKKEKVYIAILEYGLGVER